MAFADYHPCDHCCERKTFYDADMNVECTPPRAGWLRRLGSLSGGIAGGYNVYSGLLQNGEEDHHRSR
jgi:hypothetical protein